MGAVWTENDVQNADKNGNILGLGPVRIIRQSVAISLEVLRTWSYIRCTSVLILHVHVCTHFVQLRPGSCTYVCIIPNTNELYPAWACSCAGSIMTTPSRQLGSVAMRR